MNENWLLPSSLHYLFMRDPPPCPSHLSLGPLLQRCPQQKCGHGGGHHTPTIAASYIQKSGLKLMPACLRMRFSNLPPGSFSFFSSPTMPAASPCARSAFADWFSEAVLSYVYRATLFHCPHQYVSVHKTPVGRGCCSRISVECLVMRRQVSGGEAGWGQCLLLLISVLP